MVLLRSFSLFAANLFIIIVANSLLVGSDSNLFPPAIPSSPDISNSNILGQNAWNFISPAGWDMSYLQSLPQPDIVSLTGDANTLTDLKSPCAAVGSYGKVRFRRGLDQSAKRQFCPPEDGKRLLNPPDDIYDSENVLNSLQKLNLPNDFFDLKKLGDWSKKQEDYRAWNHQLADENPNKCQDVENPFYEIHVCCKGPLGPFNGVFFNYVEGCSPRALASPLEFQRRLIISSFHASRLRKIL